MILGEEAFLEEQKLVFGTIGVIDYSDEEALEIDLDTGEQLGERGRMLASAPDALEDVLGEGLGALGLDAERLEALDLSAFGLSEEQVAMLREQLRGMLADGQGLTDLLRGALGGGSVPGAAGASGAGASGAGAFGAGTDPGELLRPAAATLNALQAGQVIGQLARQVHGHHDLGVPTAPSSTAGLVAVNVAGTFDGYDLDPYEVAIVVAITEAANRRLHHAIGWLDDHVLRLIGRFAAAMTVDASKLRDLAEQMQQELDPDDPDAFQRALVRAGQLRLEPNDAQRAILAQLQVVVGIVDAWARLEAREAVAGRLPGLARIEEVLRRRRAVQGDGEALLAAIDR